MRGKRAKEIARLTGTVTRTRYVRVEDGSIRCHSSCFRTLYRKNKKSYQSA